MAAAETPNELSSARPRSRRRSFTTGGIHPSWAYVWLISFQVCVPPGGRVELTRAGRVAEELRVRPQRGRHRRQEVDVGQRADPHARVERAEAHHLVRPAERRREDGIGPRGGDRLAPGREAPPGLLGL